MPRPATPSITAAATVTVLAALAVLTACAPAPPAGPVAPRSTPSAHPSVTPPTPTPTPTPSVSPRAALTLHPRWGLTLPWPYPGDARRPVDQMVGGGSVVSLLDRDASGAAALVFTDVRTGRVAAVRRYPSSPYAENDRLTTVTDRAGHQLIGVIPGDGLTIARVYDPAGQEVWHADAPFTTYAGGYTVALRDPAHTMGHARLTVSDRPGHVIAAAVIPAYAAQWWQRPGVAAVRPGLLAIRGEATGRRRLALLDLADPGHPRWTWTATPPPPPGARAESARFNAVTAAAGHLYASWQFRVHDDDYAYVVARYDPGHVQPVWHTVAPADHLAAAGDRVIVATDTQNAAHTLNAATGHDVGPRQGWFTAERTRYGDPETYEVRALAGGLLYLAARDAERTHVVDARTGTVVATVDIATIGVTARGDLVAGHLALDDGAPLAQLTGYRVTR